MKTIQKLLLFIALSGLALAQEAIHSSWSSYYENLNFDNSKQKNEGWLVGIGADIHDNRSEYKLTYETSQIQTKQPPLKEDLETQKIFLRYGYHLDNRLNLHLNYINILADNLVPTAHGKAYGVGVGYEMKRQTSLYFTQFYTDYSDFDVYQSDFKIEYKMKIEEIGIKLTSLTHYIKLDGYETNTFSQNAKEEYLTTALKLHAHYGEYHLGMAGYFGKRAFAIMDDGFKIQHHAMEFDRTYAIGIGKSFDAVTLRLQYVTQRATELPLNNSGVEIQNIRLIANYQF